MGDPLDLPAFGAAERDFSQVDKTRLVTALSRAGHPNVVSLLGSRVIDGHVVLASDFVGGGSLAAIVRGG